MTQPFKDEVVKRLEGSPHASEKRCGFRLKVKPERMDEYVANHENVWEPMLEALSRQGWTHYSLFLDTDSGDVFGYFESEDCLRSMEGMSDESADGIWQSRMSKYFDLPDGGTPKILCQYFYLP